MVTLQQLRELLLLDIATGTFYWKHNHGRMKAGDVAGGIDGRYWRIRIYDKTYLAHRLVWLWVHGKWPHKLIDHIDGNRFNNRPSNLRDVSMSVNKQNLRKARADNKCGLLGVYKLGHKYRASIKIGDKCTHLGMYATPELAHAAYIKAKRMYHEGGTL